MAQASKLSEGGSCKITAQASKLSWRDMCKIMAQASKLSGEVGVRSQLRLQAVRGREGGVRSCTATHVWDNCRPEPLLQWYNRNCLQKDFL